MRLSLLAVLTGALVLPGCSKLVSLNPFVTEEQAAADPGLAGVWTDSGNEEIYIVKPDGKGYSITFLKDSIARFEALMFRVGDAILLDVVSDNEDGFQIPAHTPMRVWPEGSTLRMAFLDSDWLREQAEKQIPSQEANGRRVITAPGEMVRAFLLKYGADDRSYGKPEILHRAQ